MALGDLRLEDSLHLRHVERFDWAVDRVHVVVAQIGDHAAERVRDAGPRRDQELRNPEFARERRGVQRPRAAEGKEHEVARIVSARKRHHADRARHLVVRNAHDRRRHVHRIEPERLAERFGEDGFDLPEIGFSLDPEEFLRIEPSEHEVRVGDRRLGAAAPVADRPRMGARAARPDAQHAVLAEVGDRAAARADGVHVHHRHVHRHRVFDFKFGGHLRHAVEDQSDVGRGPAHVVGDRVRKTGGACGVRGGDDAGGGAGHDGIHRGLRGDRAGDGAAVPLHHEQVLCEAAALEFFRELLEVAVEDRLHGCIHRRGDAALVLAIFRKNGMAGGDVAVRPEFARNVEGALFVCRIDVAVQEMDDERFAAFRGEALGRFAHGEFVERNDLFALGVHALGDFHAQLARYQRFEPAFQTVCIGPRAAAQLQHVAEALRGDEPGLCKLPLQQCIGRGRGAVHEHPELRQRKLRLFERREHPESLVLDRGGNLGEPHLARYGVERDQVREGAANVDACDPAHPVQILSLVAPMPLQRRTPT